MVLHVVRDSRKGGGLASLLVFSSHELQCAFFSIPKLQIPPPRHPSNDGSSKPCKVSIDPAQAPGPILQTPSGIPSRPVPWGRQQCSSQKLSFPYRNLWKREKRMAPQDICNVCARAAVQTCPSCLGAISCSRSCQDTSRQLHDLICPTLAAPPPNPNPHARQVLGVLFPEPPPPSPPYLQLVWVPITGFTDPDSGISFHEPDVGPLFGIDDSGSLDSIHSERNKVRGRDTRSMLEIWHHREGDNNAHAANACVRALADLSLPGLDGSPFHDWKGPVLVLFMTRSTGFMVDPGTYRSCGQQDIVDAVDFVLDHGNDIHDKRVQRALETLGQETKKIEGVDDVNGAGCSDLSQSPVTQNIVVEMD